MRTSTMFSPTRRTGFTLFEIAISLGLLSVAIVSIMLAFPAGLKAQQFARFRIIAATKAEEMVEAFNATANANPAVDTEAFKPWDVPVGYRSQAFDLEQRLSSHRFGIMPLPTDIARRIDSDVDEIQHLLDDGAQLYYSQPMATTNTEERSLADPAANAAEAPNESQKLVFAVVGLPQNNAVHILAKKNWPYYAPYPSPPIHGFLYDEFLPSGFNMTRFQWDYQYDRDPWPWSNGVWNKAWYLQSACVEEALEAAVDPSQGSDPDIRKVFMWQEGADWYGFLPFAYGRFTGPADSDTPYYNILPDRGLPSRASLIRYVQSALWYCVQKGIDPTTYDPPSPGSIPSGFDGSPEPWKQVQALRFLAHATACMTSWYGHGTGDGGSASDGFLNDSGPGVIIPTVSLGGRPGPPAPIAINNGKIRYWHERCLRMAMQFAAENPYDWRVPRPTQRAIMMDHPLIEYDLFSPPDSGVIHGSSTAAAQWRPIPAQTVAHPGVSWMYPDHPIAPSTDPGEWGQSSHFTLTAPFTATQRCRQIVFWAVDWQSYADFETAPSAAVDASKYPFAAPHGKTHTLYQDGPTGTAYSFDHALGIGPDPQNPGDRNVLISGLEWADDQLFAYRNPEKVLMFKRDISALANHADVAADMVMNSVKPNPLPAPAPAEVYDYPDRGRPPHHPNAPLVFSGRFGADRNFNLRLDRGPLPSSVRMRAVEVARFNYYDPRVPLTIR